MACYTLRHCPELFLNYLLFLLKYGVYLRGSNTTFVFSYNVGIIWKTYRTGSFKESQLHEVPLKCKAATSGDELEKYLKKDIQETKFSLTRVLFKCYGTKYLILGIIQLLVRSLVM